MFDKAVYNAPTWLLAIGTFFKLFEPIIGGIAGLVVIAWTIVQFTESKSWKKIKRTVKRWIF